MQGLRACLLLILSCRAEGRLSAHTTQFVADYFTHKSVRVITGFTCSKHGTDSQSKSHMKTTWDSRFSNRGVTGCYAVQWWGHNPQDRDL